MNHKRFRIGSVAILFAVIVLCVSIFAVLTVVTARSDLRTAQQYGNHVLAISRCQSAGAAWLAQVEQALVAEELTGQSLPEGTTLDGNLLSTQIIRENVTLSVELELLTDGTYRVTRWSCTTNWQQAPGEQVWIQP